MLLTCVTIELETYLIRKKLKAEAIKQKALNSETLLTMIHSISILVINLK